MARVERVVSSSARPNFLLSTSFLFFYFLYFLSVHNFSDASGIMSFHSVTLIETTVVTAVAS